MSDFELEINGLERTIAAFSDHKDKNRIWLRRILNSLGDNALHFAKVFAPIQIGPQGGDLLRRLQKSDVRFRPGGAGGGGWYELLVGIIQGHPYPLYVHGGTGIYAQPSRGLIFPRKPGGWLTFQKHGEPRRYVKYVRGQKPNPFIEDAYEHTKLYARGKVASLGLLR